MSEAPQLFLSSSDNNLYYWIDNNYYNTINLNIVDPPSENLQPLITIYNFRGFSSEPILIRLANDWIIIASDFEDRLVFLSFTHRRTIQQINNQVILDYIAFTNFNFTTSNDYEPINYTPFNSNVLYLIRQLMQKGLTLNDFNIISP